MDRALKDCDALSNNSGKAAMVRESEFPLPPLDVHTQLLHCKSIEDVSSGTLDLDSFNFQSTLGKVLLPPETKFSTLFDENMYNNLIDKGLLNTKIKARKPMNRNYPRSYTEQNQDHGSSASDELESWEKFVEDSLKKTASCTQKLQLDDRYVSRAPKHERSRTHNDITYSRTQNDEGSSKYVSGSGATLVSPNKSELVYSVSVRSDNSTTSTEKTNIKLSHYGTMANNSPCISDLPQSEDTNDFHEECSNFLINNLYMGTGVLNKVQPGVMEHSKLVHNKLGYSRLNSGSYNLEDSFSDYTGEMCDTASVYSENMATGNKYASSLMLHANHSIITDITDIPSPQVSFCNIERSNSCLNPYVRANSKTLIEANSGIYGKVGLRVGNSIRNRLSDVEQNYVDMRLNKLNERAGSIVHQRSFLDLSDECDDNKGGFESALKNGFVQHQKSVTDFMRSAASCVKKTGSSLFAETRKVGDTDTTLVKNKPLFRKRKHSKSIDHTAQHLQNLDLNLKSTKTSFLSKCKKSFHKLNEKIGQKQS